MEPGSQRSARRRVTAPVSECMVEGETWELRGWEFSFESRLNAIFTLAF